MDYQDDHNPIITNQDHAEMYRNMLTDLTNLCLLTVDINREVTAVFAAAAVQAIVAGDHPDVTVSLKAFGYEVGRVLAAMGDGRPEPLFRHIPAPERDENGVDESLVQLQLETFMMAAHQGDLNAAANVVDSVVAEAKATGQEPGRFALAFVVSVFMSIVLTTRNHMIGDHTGHGCNLDPDKHDH